MKPTTTARKSRSKTNTTVSSNPQPCASHSDHAEHIAVSAYYKAQARGFAPGQELDDWLQAEAEFATGSHAM